MKAYLKQQRGYGEAEALLKYKHPDHFNTLGASHWRGKIYGGDEIGIRIGGDVIYHGVFGTGLFQTIYRRPASLAAHDDDEHRVAPARLVRDGAGARVSAAAVGGGG